jgi:PrtD family type I secretion system ABC transporter
MTERQFLGLPRPSDAMAAALRACRRHFLGVVLFSGLINLLVVVPMLYMLQIYDRVVPTRGLTTLFFITLVLLFALATSAVLDLVRMRLLVRSSIRLDRILSGPTLETALMQRAGSVQGRQGMREFDVLRQTLGGPALVALADLPWSPLFVLICFLLHPFIGLLVTAGGAVLVVVTLFNQRATTQRLREANEAAGRFYARQEEVLLNADTVRALGMRQAMVGRQVAERQSMIELQSEAGFAGGGYVTASKFIRTSLQSLSLGLGAWLAVGDQISVGAIFAASFLAGRALQPVDQMLASWGTLSRGMEAYRHINALFEGRPVDLAITTLPDPKGQIIVEKLAVARPGTQSAILAGVSFQVEPGEVLAIAGPSGAGKSTLLRTLAGAQAADLGAVRIDGAKTESWDPERLASFIGYVPQQATLFAGTIKENIARFRSGPAVDAMAVAAAQGAGAHDMILQLPAGYETMIQLGGTGLSAGQAQRIAIARALFGNPPMVLLDEPNAHLDAVGEAQLVRTMADLKARGAAVIIVAHRAGVLSTVDRILILRDGRIETIGPRDEIVALLSSKPAAEPIPLAARRGKS